MSAPVVTAPAAVAPVAPVVDLSATVAGLMQKNNQDSTKVIEMLLTENYGYRETIRTMKVADEEQKKLIPAKDSIVLSKDDGELFEKYKVLGKHDDLVKNAETHKILQGEHSTLKKNLVITSLSEIHHYNRDVLAEIVTARSLNLRIDEKKDDDGKTQKFGVVVIDDKTDINLEEYVKDNLQAFAPALAKSVEGGTPWVAQKGTAGQGPAPTKLGEALVERKYGHNRPKVPTSDK